MLREGIEIHAISRNWQGIDLSQRPNQLTYFCADACDHKKLKEGLRTCSVVYYLAYDGVPLSDGTDHMSEYRNNLLMLSASMTAAEDTGVERFVFVSSGGTVYGDAKNQPIKETEVLAPVSHYGNIKRLSESLLESYCGMTRTFKPIIARVSNPFGAEQIFGKRKGLIVASMLRIARNEPVSIFDGGKQIRDYLHSSDTIAALTVLARAPEALGQSFNISSGIGRSVLSVIDDIEEISGKRVIRKEEAGRSQDVHSNVLCGQKLYEMTGWKPKMDFHEALLKTWKAVQENV